MQFGSLTLFFGAPLCRADVTGTQDGNIQVQRFAMNERLSQLRPPNSLFPKVTKLEFTREGNRIGASDAEGAVSLWHLNVVGATAANSQPYYVRPFEHPVSTESTRG